MATTVCELQWIMYFLNNLLILVPLPISFRFDNQAAIHISHNLVFHEHTCNTYVVCVHVCEVFLFVMCILRMVMMEV